MVSISCRVGLGLSKSNRISPPTIDLRLSYYHSSILSFTEPKWLDIPEFTNYQVSSSGDIRNKQTNKFLKPYSKYSVSTVNIKNDSGIYKKRYVNRLVLKGI